MSHVADAPTPPVPELPEPRLPETDAAGRLGSSLASALDAAALWIGGIVIDATVMPRPERADALRRSAAPLVDPALLREPGRFFDFSDAPPEPGAPEVRRTRRLAGGHARELAFASDYRPWTDDRSLPARDALLVDHRVHDGGSRGTLVALHGFLMGQPRLDALALCADAWYARGLDVALPVLPHHGPRSESWISGERFAVPHVARLGEAVRRAIWELEMLLAWLRRERGGPVCVTGLSLGGYLAAILAGLDGSLDFVAAVQAPVCIGDLARRFFERSRHYRGGLPEGLDARSLREAYRVHSPLAHPPRLPPERLLVVARRGDRVVPPEHPHALWLHWGRPPIRWLAGGHLAPLGRRSLMDAVAERLAALGIPGSSA